MFRSSVTPGFLEDVQSSGTARPKTSSHPARIERQGENHDQHHHRGAEQLGSGRPGHLVHLRFDGDQEIGEGGDVDQAVGHPQRRPASSTPGIRKSKAQVQRVCARGRRPRDLSPAICSNSAGALNAHEVRPRPSPSLESTSSFSLRLSPWRLAVAIAHLGDDAGGFLLLVDGLGDIGEVFALVDRERSPRRCFPSTWIFASASTWPPWQRANRLGRLGHHDRIDPRLSTVLSLHRPSAIATASAAKVTCRVIRPWLRL